MYDAMCDVEGTCYLFLMCWIFPSIEVTKIYGISFSFLRNLKTYRFPFGIMNSPNRRQIIKHTGDTKLGKRTGYLSKILPKNEVKK